MIPQSTNKESPPCPIYRLFQFGSAECDQYEIQNDDTFESRRPIEQPYFLLNNIQIHQISCGALHTLILTTTGQIYSWGCNDDGALGRPTQIESSPGLKTESTVVLAKESYPGLVPLEFPMDMISAGDSHSVACNSKNGVVYLWGVYRNTIGGNMCQPYRDPVRWGEDEFRKCEITKVLSGCNHSLILSDEKVYAWGDPDTCVLGRMPLARRKFAQGLYIEALSVKQVLDIFTGGYHSFVKQKKKLTNKDSKKKEDHTMILGWGLNNYGQLGVGDTENTYKLKEIKEFRDLDIVDIKGGDDFTIALTRDGEVYSFGRCDDGQLGLGENWKEKVQRKMNEKSEKIREEKVAEKIAEKFVEKVDENIGGMIEENIGEMIQETKEENKEENKEPEQRKFEFVTLPIKIEGFEKIDRIYSGACYNYAVSRIKNQVYSWGSGDHYVLGSGKEETESAPFVIKPAFYKLEEVIEIGLGGQHVTLVTSNVANDWKLPELEAKVHEIDKKLLAKSKGKKEKKSSRSCSKDKSISMEKIKSVNKKMEEIKDLDEEREEIEERNEKKRKFKDNEDDVIEKKILKKTKKNI